MDTNNSKIFTKKISEWVKDLDYKEGYVEFTFKEKELTILKCNLWNSKTFPNKK